LSLPLASAWSIVARFCVRAVGGPVFLTRAVAIATCAVAHTLLGLVHQRLADDLGRLKDTMLRKAEAEAALKEAGALAAKADADRKLAEAADAASWRRRQQRPRPRQTRFG